MGDVDLIDGAGVALAAVRDLLPPQAADFEPVKTIRDPAALWEWRSHWHGFKCWWCSRPTELYQKWHPRYGEVHHMVRHDAPWALAWLCATCHRLTEEAVKEDSFPYLIRMKHHYDQENTNWELLTRAKGRFLE